MSLIPPNRLKQALRAGQPVVGTFVIEMRQPAIMQLLANAGFDFVVIDNEHGVFSHESIALLSRAAQYAGLTPIVRIPDLTYPYIAQPLDAGAQGLMIPRVSHAGQVREVVQMMKYPPQGVRGNAMGLGFTHFKSGPVAEALPQANDETMLVVQVENQAAVDHIEDIVAVPGVDAALIGPNDLSIALGLPGQIDAPPMRAAIAKTIAACQRQGVAPGIHMNNLDLAVYWAKQGMRLISSHAETGLIMKAGREVAQTIRGAFAEDK